MRQYPFVCQKHFLYLLRLESGKTYFDESVRFYPVLKIW